VATTVAIAACLFLVALTVMAALAGWHAVVDQLQPRLSFWFAVAFAAELAAFVGYVFAYRSIAHIDGGPRIGWVEAASVVAVGFGAFLAKGGGALDSKILRGRGSKQEGEVRVLALDALEHAPLAPAACAAAIALLVAGERKPGLDFSRGRRSFRSGPSRHSSASGIAPGSSGRKAGAGVSATPSRASGCCSVSPSNGGSTGPRSSARASTGLGTSPVSGRP
jgi:hypothetical protein